MLHTCNVLKRPTFCKGHAVLTPPLERHSNYKALLASTETRCKLSRYYRTGPSITDQAAMLLHFNYETIFGLKVAPLLKVTAVEGGGTQCICCSLLVKCEISNPKITAYIQVQIAVQSSPPGTRNEKYYCSNRSQNRAD